MTMMTAKKTLIPFGGKVGKIKALIRVTCKKKKQGKNVNKSFQQNIKSILNVNT